MLIGRKPIGTVGLMSGLPCVLEEFSWSLAQLVSYSQIDLCSATQYVHLDRVTMSDHAPARNTLAERFLGDWLLMLDTDHRFDPDILARLLHRMYEHGFDCMVGVYQFKRPPYTPVLFTWHEGGGAIPVGGYPKEAPLFRVGSSGGGCLLVRRRVFDRIHKDLGEAPFDRIHPFSEDHSFFKRLQRLGIPVWADSRIECNHLRVAPVTAEDIEMDTISSEMIPVQGFAG